MSGCCGVLPSTIWATGNSRRANSHTTHKNASKRCLLCCFKVSLGRHNEQTRQTQRANATFTATSRYISSMPPTAVHTRHRTPHTPNTCQGASAMDRNNYGVGKRVPKSSIFAEASNGCPALQPDSRVLQQAGQQACRRRIPQHFNQLLLTRRPLTLSASGDAFRPRTCLKCARRLQTTPFCCTSSCGAERRTRSILFRFSS